MTRKRVLIGVVAAATAGIVLGVLPGSSSDSAYAVERNHDGTLTISMHELDWSGGNFNQFEKLAGKIRAAGFTAEWEKIPAGKTCQPDNQRGTDLPQQHVRDRHGKWTYQYTMTHKDAFLVREFLSGSRSMNGQGIIAHSLTERFVKGPPAPCKLRPIHGGQLGG